MVLSVLLRQFWARRIVRFGVVALFCTLLQYVILFVLVSHGWEKLVANGTGFLLSAQANYGLSSLLTWGDRWASGAVRLQGYRWRMVSAVVWRWCKFNLIALAALLVNEAVVFVLAIHVGISLFPAVPVGTVAGAMITFVMNNVVTFRRFGHVPTLEFDLNHPEWEEIQTYIRESGVAFFLPAYNEGRNLLTVVGRLVAYFRGIPCTVIIVDDGSTDNTGEIAASLASELNAVRVVRHPVNLGYGAGLRTGLLAAGDTDHELVAFFDADNQFRIEDFPKLVAAMVRERADFAVGRRAYRADPWLRRLTGGGWQLICRLMLQVKAADIDCGFKVFSRSMMQSVAPQLTFRRGAAVSPELFARASNAGFRFAEVEVAHFPRLNGEQSGVKLRVIAASFADLLRLRLELWAKLVGQKRAATTRNVED